MTWKDLLDEGRIKRHQTSRAEIEALRTLVARDIADAKVQSLSTDRKFATAYNAALQSAKMVIACSGYRVQSSSPGGHICTLDCLKLAMGKPVYKTANFLDRCRKKRNIADYDAAGRISETEAGEMMKTAQRFSQQVEKWIRQNYPVYG